MPDGEGEMGWLSNLNMDNLGEGLDRYNGVKFHVSLSE